MIGPEGCEEPAPRRVGSEPVPELPEGLECLSDALESALEATCSLQGWSCESQPTPAAVLRYFLPLELP